MPVNSVLSYIRVTLDTLPLPGGVPSLACWITPPDPNTDAEIPVAYVWPSSGRESRDGPAGTTGRNTGPGTMAGFKTIEHDLDCWLTWFGNSDDADADTLFPGIVDAVMAALRTATPAPVLITDPYSGYQTWLADTGERIEYKTDVRAVADQRYLRYDAQLTLHLAEVIQA